jgi:hypothetical protein
MIRTFATAMVLAFVAPNERLAMPLPEGFVVGHQQTAQSGTIEERIPRGETVEKWSRMITILKINTAASAATYATNFEATIAGACPGTRTTHAAASLAGHQAIDGRMDCPRNPSTGLPETFFFRALSSGSAIHMVQVAFRHVPDARETGWARSQIQGATFCAAGSRQAACK